MGKLSGFVGKIPKVLVTEDSVNTHTHTRMSTYTFISFLSSKFKFTKNVFIYSFKAESLDKCRQTHMVHEVSFPGFKYPQN